MALRKLATLLAAGTLAAGTVLGLTGSASATAQPDFSAQAQKAGLSSAQAEHLQTEVDGYVAKTGGTQVSANKILIPGGDMVVRAPGQKVAQDLADPSAISPKLTCAYGHLCGAADGAGGNGATFDYYYCGYYELPGLVGDGHWINNQTSGTVAYFYNSDGSFRWATGGAYSTGTASWTPVWYVSPC
jgi:hypothetical protein